MAMRRYLLLVPVTDNDGGMFPEELVVDLQIELFDQFGGISLTGTVYGAYRPQKVRVGTVDTDVSLQYWIVIEEAREQELRKKAAEIAGRLGQESLYFEKGGIVEFIEPGTLFPGVA